MGFLQTYHWLMVLLRLLISKLVEGDRFPSRVTASHIAFADYVVVGLVTWRSRKPRVNMYLKVCVLKFRIGSCFLRTNILYVFNR